MKRSKEVGHTMIIDVSHSLSTNGSRKKGGKSLIKIHFTMQNI